MLFKLNLKILKVYVLIFLNMVEFIRGSCITEYGKKIYFDEKSWETISIVYEGSRGVAEILQKRHCLVTKTKE